MDRPILTRLFLRPTMEEEAAAAVAAVAAVEIDRWAQPLRFPIFGVHARLRLH
jgi:hypothetical protein